MDVQHHSVVEVQEQMLPVRRRPQQRSPVQELRPGSETALGAAHGKRLTGENVTELAGEPVDGVPFRHYSTTSPVVS
jgi:hypothetical protein